MNKLTVYFIRHGTTTMNKQGRFCGSTDALLDPDGWDELRKLKKEFGASSVMFFSGYNKWYRPFLQRLA